MYVIDLSCHRTVDIAVPGQVRAILPVIPNTISQCSIHAFNSIVVPSRDHQFTLKLPESISQLPVSLQPDLNS